MELRAPGGPNGGAQAAHREAAEHAALVLVVALRSRRRAGGRAAAVGPAGAGARPPRGTPGSRAAAQSSRSPARAPSTRRTPYARLLVG